jgi:hypothetical protein
VTISTQIANRRLHLSSLIVAAVALPFSIEVCHWALVLYIIVWCAEGKWTEKMSLFRKSLLLQISLVLALMFLAGMWYTENKTAGWLSLEKKIFFFIMPLALATSAVKFSQREIRILLYCFVSTCFIASVICIVNSILMASHSMQAVPDGLLGYLNTSDFNLLNPSASDEWLLFSYQALAIGLGMHPAYLSMYVAFCIVFLLHEVGEKRSGQKYITIICLALIAYFSVFIICLTSRIITLSLLSVYIATGIISLLNRTSGKKVIALFCLLLLCVLVLYVNPVSRYKNLQEVQRTSFLLPKNTTAHTATQIRAALLWISWESFKRINPVIGAGTGDVEEVMQQASETLGTTNDHHTANPHNEYISIVLAIGLMGLTFFIASLAIPVMMAFGHRDYLLMGFIFLFAALCLSESVLERQKGVAFFAIFFPLLAFQRQAFQTFSITSKILRAQS